jgi:hypothetical protein
MSSWWNGFTSNWFSKTTPSNFYKRPARNAESQQMLKNWLFQKPRVVGAPVKDIDVYEQWK